MVCEHLCQAFVHAGAEEGTHHQAHSWSHQPVDFAAASRGARVPTKGEYDLRVALDASWMVAWVHPVAESLKNTEGEAVWDFGYAEGRSAS